MYVYIVSCIILYRIYTHIMYVYIVSFLILYIYTHNWGSKLLFWNLGFQLVRVDLERVYCFLWELWVPSKGDGCR